MPLGRNELSNRFGYHPATPETGPKHDEMRNKCRALANYLDKALPDGREKASAITHLEQVMFWGNAGIARPGAPLGKSNPQEAQEAKKTAAPALTAEGKVDGRSKAARALRAARAESTPPVEAAEKPVRKVTRTRKAS